MTLAVNIFCPTGSGGGVDPTCGKGGGRVDRILEAASGIAVTEKEVYSSSECGHGEWCKTDEGTRVFRFDTASGLEYGMRAEVIPGVQVAGQDVLDVEFHDENYETGVTGAGSALEVFMNVVPAVAALVQKTSPPALTFTAVEQSRQKLYDRLVKSIAAADPRYKAYAVRIPIGGTFYIVGKREHDAEVQKLSSLVKKGERQVLVNAYADPEWWTREAWTENMFCPTGPGGGVDPTCGKGDKFTTMEGGLRELSSTDLPRPLAMLGDLPAPDHVISDYLEKHGKEWEAAALPEGVSPGVPKECYKNATLLMMGRPDLSYVEGIAYSHDVGKSIGFLHAWCVGRDGKVVDPTWKDPEKARYFGVKYPRGKYELHLAKTRVYGVVGGERRAAQKVMKKGGL